VTSQGVTSGRNPGAGGAIIPGMPKVPPRPRLDAPGVAPAVGAPAPGPGGPAPAEVGLGPAPAFHDPRAAARADRATLEAVRAGRLSPAEGLARIHLGGGLPIVADGKTTFVAEPGVAAVAGVFSGWRPVAMTDVAGLRVLEVEGELRGAYKLLDGQGRWSSDPWARAYGHDAYGEHALIRPEGPHLERFRAVGGHGLPPRAIRVWIPAEPPTHHLYMQDGQNLFEPDAMFGGWRMQSTAGPRTLIVGVDNAGLGRFDEYTHTPDRVNGQVVGGRGDDYVDFLVKVVRPRIEATYGAPRKVGVMGSSLGGLVAMHAAARHPNAFDFVGAMSPTLGWGQMGEGMANETMIERYRALPRMRRPKFYLDSGGAPGGGDNHDVTRAMADVLAEGGYRWSRELWHWHEPNAPHREDAWAARVARPLAIFEAL
jgi:predicted alpha/beta superfamily hydrolase